MTSWKLFEAAGNCSKLLQTACCAVCVRRRSSSASSRSLRALGASTGLYCRPKPRCSRDPYALAGPSRVFRGPPELSGALRSSSGLSGALRSSR
eukprot:2406441-Alexandrium_andersonii.AAC.1